MIKQLVTKLEECMNPGQQSAIEAIVKMLQADMAHAEEDNALDDKQNESVPSETRSYCHARSTTTTSTTEKNRTVSARVRTIVQT